MIADYVNVLGPLATASDTLSIPKALHAICHGMKHGGAVLFRASIIDPYGEQYLIVEGWDAHPGDQGPVPSLDYARELSRRPNSGQSMLEWP